MQQNSFQFSDQSPRGHTTLLSHQQRTRFPLSPHLASVSVMCFLDNSYSDLGEMEDEKSLNFISLSVKDIKHFSNIQWFLQFFFGELLNSLTYLLIGCIWGINLFSSLYSLEISPLFRPSWHLFIFPSASCPLTLVVIFFAITKCLISFNPICQFCVFSESPCHSYTLAWCKVSKFFPSGLSHPSNATALWSTVSFVRHHYLSL